VNWLVSYLPHLYQQGFTMSFTFTSKGFSTLAAFFKLFRTNQSNPHPRTTEVATIAHHGIALWKHHSSNKS
jgi:hypothetical protein